MPNVFAFDLETYLIQPARHAPKAVCASWAWGHQRQPTKIDMGHMNPRFGQRDIVHDVLEKALKDFEVITGINLAFDLAVIALEYPDLWPLIWKAYREDRIQDGMISEKLLDIAKGQREWLTLPDGSVIKPQYSLAEIAKRRLGIDLEKDMWRLRYGTLYDTPLHLWEPSARDYSLLDAGCAYDAFVSQVSEPNAQVFLQDAPRQARAGWWLHLMSTWGARVSGPALDALEAYVRSELAKISALLLQYNLVDKKGKRNTKVAAERMVYVRTALNLPIPTTDTGKVKLDEESCIDTGDSALEAYAKYTSFKTVLNKDVTALREAVVANMPVQTVFDSLKATGRTGSSGGKRKKGVDPSAHSFQMQNVRKPFPRPKLANGILGAQPPGVRECFVPREGFWICSIDYGQMELHAWAQVCLDLLGFSDLAKMLNAGVDVHCKLGSMVVGKTYEEVFAARKKEQWAKDARQMAKCFHPETEVLTKQGWVRIDALSMGTEVAAAQVGDAGDTKIVWEQPTRLTQRHAKELVHLKNKGIDLRVTPDHRMVGWIADQRGAKAKRARGEPVEATLGRAVECTPEELSKLRAWPSAGTCDSGAHLDEERILRLAVATQADGTYRKNGEIHLGFSKQRKIDRLRSLLNPDEYDFAVVRNGKHQDTKFFKLSKDLSAKIRALLDADKTLPWWWVGMSLHDREIILDEAKHWDSNVNRFGRMFRYSSALKKNIDVLQAIAALTGRKSRIRREEDHTASDGIVSQAWVLSVKDHHETRGGALKPKRVPYDGTVYCLTVPSDAILVRDGGITTITKQCSNFGFPGGLGAKAFQAYAKTSWGLILTEEQSYALKDLWFLMLSEAKPYFALIGQLADSPDALIRQTRSSRYRGDIGFTDGANGFFQGLAADTAKDAGFLLAEACYIDEKSPLFGSRPWNMVHDEFLFEVPIDRAHEAAWSANKIMEDTGKRWMPDCPPRSVPALMEAWYKDAEDVYDENGRLTVWRPK